jgi:hypothetical protein
VRPGPAALTLTGVVALAAFVVAYDDGGYSLESRSAVATVVWWTILVGLALGVWRFDASMRGALVPGALLGLLAAWDLFSAGWSSAERALNEADRTFLYLGIFVLVVLVSRPGRLGAFVDGLTIAIVATAAVALTSRLVPGSFPGRGLSTLFPAAANRLSFPVGYWNGLGVLVGIAFPLLIGSSLAGGHARRLVSLGVLPVLGAVIYLTSSRGAVLATAAGTLVVVAAHPRRLAALGAALAAAIGAVAAVAALSTRHALVDGPFGSATARMQGREAIVVLLVICLATAFLFDPAARAISRLPAPGRGLRVLGVVSAAAVVLLGILAVARSLRGFTRLPGVGDTVSGHLLSGAGSGRWQFWTAALDEFRRFPVHGGGAGSFAAWWTQHGSFVYVVRDAHSLFLDTLAELGIVGLALLVGFLASAVVTATRRLLSARGDTRAAIASLLGAVTVYLLGAAVDWMWQLTVVSATGVAILGLLTGPATSAAGPAPAQRRDSVVAAGLGIAACAILVAEVIVLLGDVEVGRSQAAVRAGRYADARAAARLATRIEPWAASPYLQLALTQEASGNLDAASRAIDRATARDPRDWQLWLTRARIENGLGRYERGAASLARARALNPRSPELAPSG